MDLSEESQQQQFISGGADQMANILPPFNATPDSTSYNVSVPMFSTMQPPPTPLISASQQQIAYQPPPPPPPMVSASQHQIGHQEAQAQHQQHVRERLRQFWANQMQEMTPEDIKKHSLPLAPINRIMKADKDVKMIAKETSNLFAKACEMFILDLTSHAWINTEEDGRRTLQNKDIAAAIYKTDLYDYLEEVIQKHQSKEQNPKATNSRGSSTKSTIPNNNVPQHGAGISIGTSSGAQQPPPSLPSYQSGPQNHQSVVPDPQSQYQQSQQQPSMVWPQTQYHQQSPTPWPQDQDQQNQQQPFMSWPQTEPEQNQQQPFMPWPDHTPVQSPMSWLDDVLIPDLFSPQDEEMPDQEQNDD